MASKLYTLTSGGAIVVTALGALLAPSGRNQNAPPATPEAVDRSGAVVDLGAQADRLKTRLAEATAYRQPSRDAFRFGASRRPAGAAPPEAAGIPAPVVAPARPPYALAGMAVSMENGVAQRTAILSSLQGVLLVKEGDVLATGYRVVSIADDAVTLESPNDGTQTTLRLPSVPQ
jgi:hypothetical protein